jgi:hypothetical protein
MNKGDDKIDKSLAQGAAGYWELWY